MPYAIRTIPRKVLTRRSVIGGLLTSTAGVLTLTACSAPPSPVNPAPTAPPAAPPPAAAPPKPAEQPAANPTAQPAATQAPPKPQTMERWRYAEASKNFVSAFRHMGKEKGFHRELGLDVEIQQVGSGTTVIKALLAGEFDVAEIGFSPIIPSIEKGAEMKLLGAFTSGLTYAFYVRREIGSLADLDGRSVGAGEAGSLLDQLTRLLMLDEGRDHRQLNMVNIGNSPQVFKAVAIGKIDAGVSGVEFLPELSNYPDVKSLFLLSDRLPKYILNGVITSDRVIKDKPDVLQRFVIGQARGVRWAMDHKDEAVTLAMRETGLDRQPAEWSYDWHIEHKVFNPNFGIPDDQLRYMQESAVQLGEQRAVLPADKVADFSFQKKAVSQLGPYKS